MVNDDIVIQRVKREFRFIVMACRVAILFSGLYNYWIFWKESKEG